MKVSDRDALFGMLSVQLGLVDPQALAACADTVIRKRQDADHTLADQLVEEGELGPNQRELLDTMIQRAVESQDGDTKRALDVLGGESAVYQTFGPSVREGGDSLEEDPTWVTTEHPARYSGRKEIGRGGLGLVLAVFDEHLGREIATKELLSNPGPGRQLVTPATSGSLPEVVSRFLREARVTAQLEHPNIVPVYELGQRKDGTLYYTMKIVRGRTLKAALASAQDLSDRLLLLGHFVDLCHALAYAHSRGVVHRDIKPDNVMLGEFGETVLLDWGVAKVRGKKDIRSKDLARNIELLQDEQAAQTLPGDTFGTPAFMSPEQAEGKIDAIDERSDIWSLGVVLYQILTGKLPFTGTNVGMIMLKVVQSEIEPVREACPEVPREMAAVAERALQRDKSERYQSAMELADEIDAFRSGARVEAYEYSSIELLRRFLSHNRSAVLVSFVAFLILILVGIGANLRLIDERDRALKAEALSRRHLADAHAANAETLAHERRYAEAEVGAAAALTRAETPVARGVLMAIADTWRPQLLWQKRRTWSGCIELVHAPSGEYLACATSLGVQLWHAANGAEYGRFESKSGWAHSLDFAPDSNRLVFGTDDGAIQIWDVDERKQKERILLHKGAVLRVRYFEDGLSIASAGEDGGVKIWRPNKETVIAEEKEPITSLAVAADGTVAWASNEGAIFMHRKGKTMTLTAPHLGWTNVLAFGPKGEILASSGKEDPRVFLWDTRAQRLLARLTIRGEETTSLTISPDRHWLYAGAKDGTMRRFDLSRGRLDARLLAHSDRIWALTLAKNGDRLFSASSDKSVRAWALPVDVPTQQRLVEPTSVAFALGSDAIAIATKEGILLKNEEVWLEPRVAGTLSVRFAPDGKSLAAAGSDQLIHIWNLSSKKKTMELSGHVGEVRAVVYGSSNLLASAGLDGTVRLWDATTGKETALLRDHDGAVSALCFSPNGTLLASAGKDPDIRIWHVSSKKLLKKLRFHDEGVGALAFSPNGRSLAAAGNDRTVKIFRVENGRVTAQYRGHTEAVRAVAYSSDGRYLATGGADRTVRIWSTKTEKEVASIAHHRPLLAVFFTPDDSELITVAERLSRWRLDNLHTEGSELLERALKTYGLKVDGMSVEPR